MMDTVHEISALHFEEGKHPFFLFSNFKITISFNSTAANIVLQVLVVMLFLLRGMGGIGECLACG